MEGKSLAAYIVSRVEGAYVHAEEIIDVPAPSADPAQGLGTLHLLSTAIQ